LTHILGNKLFSAGGRGVARQFSHGSARQYLSTEGHGHLQRMWPLKNSLGKGEVTNKAILKALVEEAVGSGRN